MKRNIIIIAVVILAGVAVFALVQEFKTAFMPQEPVGAEKEAEKTIPSVQGEQEVLTEQEAGIQSQLTIQARAFIERHGSYSSDSGYENLTELLDFMSEKLAVESSVKIEQGIDQEQGFFGFVTKVGSVELLAFDQDSRAEFRAQVQEQEMRPGQTDIRNKTVDLVFVKEQGAWKVDSISFK